MRSLTICPTKNRPELCRNMVSSFNNTIKTDNTLVLGINIDDHMMSAYNDIKDVNKVYCKADATVTTIINDIYRTYPDYDFYHIVNDDTLYITYGWDKYFIDLAEEYGHGVFYGNDLFQGENLPTFPFISAPIIKAAGWLQLPTLNRYAGDVVWKFIGKHCDCLYYLDGVIIKHTWNGCAQPEINTEDMKRFAEWLPTSHLIIERVKGVL